MNKVIHKILQKKRFPPIDIFKSFKPISFQLLHLLGVPKKWSIVDVYGLDEDALAYIPKPVLALILLCPGTDQVLI